MLTWWTGNGGSRTDRADLTQKGELLLFETSDMLEKVSTQLSASAGLFRADESVSPTEFRSFVEGVGVIPGLAGMGYVPIVSGARLDDWLAYVQSDVAGLTLTEMDGGGDVVPAGTRELYFPIVYFEPGDAEVIGLDLGADPDLRRQLIDGLPAQSFTMTGFVGDALPDPLGGVGHVLVARAIADPDSGAVQELVVAAVDLAELIGGNAAPELTAGLDLSVADTTGVTVPTRHDGDVWEGTVDFGGRSWLLSVRDQGAGSRWLQTPAILSLAAGLAITGLLGLVVYLVVGAIEARSEVQVLESISSGKDEFLAAVSHRLRTPLTSVVGFSEVLRDIDPSLSDADRRELVSTIAIQAIELGHLFDNLLTVTRESERAPFIAARVDLAAETRAVLDTAEPVRRAAVGAVSSESGVMAAGDSALVRQILRNLLANATDFGSVVEVAIAREGLVARVTVRDNGPGISPDRVADAFALYGSRGEAGQPDSMGVGLYVSRRLARRMSGDLTYRRADGWTIFELTLPALPTTVVIRPIPDTMPAL